METKHITLIKKVFPESAWKKQFTHIDKDFYTYDAFIKSVAEFPAFCNETNRSDETLEDACKKELATFFAHATQETGHRDGDEVKDEWWRQGLYYREELNHHPYKSYAWGNDTKWPNVDDVKYYGRGPLQVSWNYNYG